MQRDSRKSEPYFTGWIAFDDQETRQTQLEIDAKEYPPKGLVLGSSQIFNNVLHRLVMRYSRGDESAQFGSDLRDLLKAREQVVSFSNALPVEDQPYRTQFESLDPDFYVQSLWWLGFVVGSGMDDEYIAQALQLIDNTGQDGLLDRIAVALGDTNRSVASGVLYKQYTPLLEAIDGPESKRAAAVKNFLGGWYKGSRNVYWHGNDKGDDTGYMGYWAFEAALVVILFDIDDTSFRDNVYYPKDLVTDARARTKQASVPPTPSITPARVPAGQSCPQSGYWFTPAKADSRRHFKSGDVFPDVPGAAYGTVLWQWAPDQV